MSYAKDSKATDVNQRVADFNHFLIFDPRVGHLLCDIHMSCPCRLTHTHTAITWY
jgi:hypothetical protein